MIENLSDNVQDTVAEGGNLNAGRRRPEFERRGMMLVAPKNRRVFVGRQGKKKYGNG